MEILFVAQRLTNVLARSPTDRPPYQNSKVKDPLVNLRCQGTAWCKFRDILTDGSCGIEAQSFSEKPWLPRNRKPGGVNFHIKSLPLCPKKSACCDVREGWAMNPNIFWGLK